MNVRHISLYNEFKLSSSNNGLYFNVGKNVNCISLNSSQQYRIKNLSIDIGSSSLQCQSETFLNALPTFPLRFYLSDNPIVDSFYDGYTLGALSFNGVSSPSVYNYNQIDRADSSNQSAYCLPNAYNNYLQTEQTNATGDFNHAQKKTNTVAEYNFFSQNQSYVTKFDASATAFVSDYLSNITNNNITNFMFNSNNENNLSFCIFPRLKLNSTGSLYTYQTITFSMCYTINFDLIEENL